jgi:hypothetical protein
MTLYDDQQVDELVLAVRARFVTRSDLTFDFEAGLADVYDRAGLPFDRVPVRPRRPGPPPESAAAALAVESLSDFCSLLDRVWLAVEESGLPGSQIQRAREVLARLAARLGTGSVPAAAAAAALASAADLLGLADVMLRVHRGQSLDELMTATAPTLTGYTVTLDGLRQEITAALREADRAPSRTVARARPRRGYGGTHRHRSIGGQ